MLKPAFASAASAAGSATPLGQAVYGTAAPAARDPDPGPFIPLPVLGDSGALAEQWHAGGPVAAGRCGDFCYRTNGELLFGWLALDETTFVGSGERTALQLATASAYRQLFAALQTLNHPQLLRVWNFIPAINAADAGEERYRRFNADRQLAFAEAGRAVEGGVPAATAVGSTGSKLIVYCLAGRDTAAVPIENPRQVSAYHYPPEHGRRSPTFSRAGLIGRGDEALLLISGTASIVGHTTVHAGDVAAQTRELLANIELLIDAANRLGERRFDAGDLLYKAYLRHPADLDTVRTELIARLGQGARIAYLQADICRADLLVEVEACSAGARP